MLLNQLRKQQRDLDDLKAEVRMLRSLQSRLEALEAVGASAPASMAPPTDSR
jgi:hypothetical protein